MKLRIKDNTVRLRLSMNELEKLANGFDIEMHTCFGKTTMKTLVISNGYFIEISFSNGEVIIVFPQEKAKELLESNEEGMGKNLVFDNGKQLKLLIQKDYKCIGRAAELNEGLFPNPKEKNK